MANRKVPGALRVSERARGYSVQRSAVYVESSAVIAAVLEGDAEVHKALSRHARIITSSLTFAECWRALVRARVSGRLTQQGEDQARHALRSLLLECVTVPMTDEILERTGRAFPVEPVRTLDAIHLASLEWLAMPVNEVLLVTRDCRVRENAVAMGFQVA